MVKKKTVTLEIETDLTNEQLEFKESWSYTDIKVIQVMVMQIQPPEPEMTEPVDDIPTTQAGELPRDVEVPDEPDTGEATA